MMHPKKSRVLAALSGGVDSSVAAGLLLRDGFDCIGATMKLFDGENPRGCCTFDDVSDARQVAGVLGIPFYVFNFSEQFEAEVISKFYAAYSTGITPNPCIDCNKHMKFGHFWQRGIDLGADYVASGHYARVVRDNERWLLLRGRDHQKDQSYVLYFMTQQMLAHTLFPLGDLTKAQVRDLAAQMGFVTANKRDSQDICFAGSKSTAANAQAGLIRDASGKQLGVHGGICGFTIGQRKGLGIAHAHPLYVTGICAACDTITVGDDSMLYSRTLDADCANFIAVRDIQGSLRCTAKIRYAHKPAPARAWQTASSKLHIEFETPQRAITPGQAVVLYDGDVVIGGGIISNNSGCCAASMG